MISDTQFDYRQVLSGTNIEIKMELRHMAQFSVTYMVYQRHAVTYTKERHRRILEILPQRTGWTTAKLLREPVGELHVLASTPLFVSVVSRRKIASPCGAS